MVTQMRCLSRVRLVLLGALISVLAAACNCGGNAAQCERSSECPTGYQCHETDRVCVRVDSSGLVRDAGSDAGAVAEGGMLDRAGRDDARHPDATASDRSATDSTGVDRGPGDGSGIFESSMPPDRAMAADAASATDLVPPRDAARLDTHQVTPPTVIITPPDGRRGVASGQQVILDFSEPMNQASVESAFALGMESSAVPGSWSWSSQQAVFTPSALVSGASYTALLAGTCRDAEGDLLAGQGGADCAAPGQCSTFVVADGVAPTVTMLPTAGSTDLPPAQAITLTFSEPMERASVNVSIAIGSSNANCNPSWTGQQVLSCGLLNIGCGQTVTVSVLDGARDPSGSPLLDTCLTRPGAAYCAGFTTRPTHQECEQCSDGCWDVRTAEHGCSCDDEEAAPGDTPPCSGSSWCIGCGSCTGSYDCSCAYHCHFDRVEKSHQCNCHQVCS